MAWMEVEEILVSRIRDILPPSNAQQAEALAPLRKDPAVLEAVWREAVSTHEGHPTGTQVKAVADRVRPPRQRQKAASTKVEKPPSRSADAQGDRNDPDSQHDPDPPPGENPPVEVVPGLSEIFCFFGDLNTPGWPTGQEAAVLSKSSSLPPATLRYALAWMTGYVAEFAGEGLNGDTAPVVSIDQPRSTTRSGRRRRPVP
jgi:hypothetical protein